MLHIMATGDEAFWVIETIFECVNLRIIDAGLHTNLLPSIFVTLVFPDSKCNCSPENYEFV